MTGRDAVLRAAARRYAAAGRGVAWSARSKLGLDPVYAALLDRGIAGAGRVLDLGCGRGLALAVSLAAGARGDHVGIERSARALAIARHALGPGATLVEADLAEARLPRAEAILILDVLHYLDRGLQEALLDRVRAALPAGGRVFVREADAGAGRRFLAVRFSERLMAVARGEGGRGFCYRSSGAWGDALAGRGLDVEVVPMGAGTPFANVLLVGRAPA